MIRTTMATKKQRGYRPRDENDRRREVLQDAGLEPPPLSAWQMAKLYDLEKLAADAEMAPSTLRRVLLGLHEREPIASLAAIAGLPGWRKVPGAPTDLAGWRSLWAVARREAERSD